MLNIVTAVAIVLLGIGLIWGGFLWARSGGVEHDEITPDFLVGLGRGLGLDDYTQRDYFGERIQVLSGEFRDLFVELEISDGNWRPYLRLVVEFDAPLERDVAVYSDDRSGLTSYVQRVRELEIGDDAFDFNFLLYAPDAEAITEFLHPPTRDQMLRLVQKVEELRLTDHSLFLFVGDAVGRDEVKSILKKSVELADRVESDARFLGPRNPETAASQYEQATIEQAVRADSGRTTVGSGERTRRTTGRTTDRS